MTIVFQLQKFETNSMEVQKLHAIPIFSSYIHVLDYMPILIFSPYKIFLEKNFKSYNFLKKAKMKV